MDKILFFDTSNNGHHYKYNFATMDGLNEINSMSEIHYYSPLADKEKIDELIAHNINPVIYNENSNYFHKEGNRQRVHMLFKMLAYARKNKVKHIHLLYVDNLCLALILLFPLLLGFHITATLHWFPNRFSKRIILKILLGFSFIRKLVVHGQYTWKLVAELIGEKECVKKVNSIVYPNLHNEKVNGNLYDVISENLKSYDTPYLLAFGGLRHDKGIDILLEALSLINNHKLTLIIAGSEDFFSREFVNELIKRNKLENKVYLDLQFISDEKLAIYFELSDIIILPYRSCFSGQSGPLTEGVSRSKLVIGPNVGEIGYTIKYYGLGETFEVENTSSLAEEISKTIQNLDEKKSEIKMNQERYQRFLSQESFVNSYNDFFN